MSDRIAPIDRILSIQVADRIYGLSQYGYVFWLTNRGDWERLVAVVEDKTLNKDKPYLVPLPSSDQQHKEDN